MCDIVFFSNKNVCGIVKRQRLELLCENLLGKFNFVSVLLLFIVLVGNACNEDKYKVGQTILNFVREYFYLWQAPNHIIILLSQFLNVYAQLHSTS